MDHEMLDAISDMMENKLKPELLFSMSDMIENKLKPELMLSMSDMMDNKLKPINVRLTKIELTQENDILPRLQSIEACYTSTYKRYQADVEKIDAMQDDIDILKKVVADHSEKLQKLA